MPLPSTRVIPSNWSKHHQRTVEGAFNARVLVTDPSRSTPGTLDPNTGTYGPPTPFIVSGGPSDVNEGWRTGVPCRIQQNNDERVVEQADEDLVVRYYLIQFPVDIPLFEIGYHAEVTVCDNDPQFIGAVLRATDRMHGSEAFNRDLMWVHNMQRAVS